MKIAVYLARECIMRAGYDMVAGVASEVDFSFPPCTLFVDTETGIVVIDSAHTPPPEWTPARSAPELEKTKEG